MKKILKSLFLLTVIMAITSGCNINKTSYPSNTDNTNNSTESNHSYDTSIQTAQDSTIIVESSRQESIAGSSSHLTSYISQVSKTDSCSALSGLDPTINRYSKTYIENINLATGYDEGVTGKNVFLTFDDGPSSINTPRVLATLKKYNVKATFFVCGPDSPTLRKLIKQEFDEGHTIGIHCYSHNLTALYKSEESFFADFNKIEAIVYETTGVKPTIYRFPGGTNNDYVKKALSDSLIIKLKERGYEYYDWSISSFDSNTPPADQISNNIISQCDKMVNAKRPSIVLAHDSASRTTTADALEVVLKNLIDKDYYFDSLKKTVKPVHFIKK